MNGTFDYLGSETNPIEVDIVLDFIEESAEKIHHAEHYLLQLDKHPRRLGLVRSLFQALHTIKGSAGFIGAQEFVKLAHAMEDYLVPYRDHHHILSPDSISLMLEGIDTLNALLSNLRMRADQLQNKLTDLESLEVDLDKLVSSFSRPSAS
jgi:two-component system chemotaxis sensor kinase CheA